MEDNENGFTLDLCVCSYVDTFIDKQMDVYRHAYMHIFMRTYVCTFAHLHTCTYTYTHKYVHTHPALHIPLTIFLCNISVHVFHINPHACLSTYPHTTSSKAFRPHRHIPPTFRPRIHAQTRPSPWIVKVGLFYIEEQCSWWIGHGEAERKGVLKYL